MRDLSRIVSTLPALCLVLLASVTSPPASAQSSEEAAVAQAVEAMRKAMFARDPKQYELLVSENVSYGHSGGRIENKKEFIAASLANKSVMKSLTFTDQTIQVNGDRAIVRNTYNGVSELDGKTNNTKIGVLMIWANEGGTWRLYARQAYRL
jgi:ketosteroid isomerase-like protein